MKRFFRRFAAAASAVAVLGMGLAVAPPAHALLGPTPRTDLVEQVQSGLDPVFISVNLLENDSWDPEHTAEVIEVTLTGAQHTWLPSGDLYLMITPTKTTDHWVSAQGTYKMRDSAGQTSIADISVRVNFQVDSPLVAVDDIDWLGGKACLAPAGGGHKAGHGCGVPGRDFSRVVTIRDGASGGLHVWENDSPSPSDGEVYRRGLHVEVLTQPTNGTVTGTETLTFRPHETPTDDQFVFSGTSLGGVLSTQQTWTPILGRAEMTYRICDADKTTCSDPAQVAFDYIWERSSTPAGRIIEHYTYTGGPDSYTVDDLTEGLLTTQSGNGVRLTAEALAGTTLYLGRAQNIAMLDPRAEYPGGPVTITRDSYARAVWRDSTSDQVVAVLDMVLGQLKDPPAPVTGVPDEWWAATGQSITVSPLVNDPTLQWYQYPPLVLDAPIREWYAPYMHVGGANLGTIWDKHQMNYVRDARHLPDESFAYFAGDTPGVETLTYRICHGHPTDLGCGEESTIKINVNPNVAAENDEARTDADEPVTIPVLDNDTFTDIEGEGAPDPRRAVVTIVDGSLPDDVTAVVNDDRTITVTAPAAYDGQTVTGEYRLRDYTGSTTARFEVQVGDAGDPPPAVEPPVTPPPAVEPPVEEPPVVTPPVEEPPVVAGPKARDDRARAVHSTPVTVKVLGNDRWTGDARVRIVKGSVPAGVTARVDGKGRVILTAPERLAGETYTVRYRLTDDTGKRSTATVRVSVAPEVVIVTGADREAPTTVEADADAAAGPSVGLAATGLLAGLFGALFLWRRTRRVAAGPAE